MRRKSLQGEACPIARSLDVIGDWWSLLIVRDPMLGLRRFGEFQKSLGLSKNILTQRLKRLVANGILDSVPASDGSAYRDYVLTRKGRDLSTVLIALRQWGVEHQFGGDPAAVPCWSTASTSAPSASSSCAPRMAGCSATATRW